MWKVPLPLGAKQLEENEVAIFPDADDWEESLDGMSGTDHFLARNVSGVPFGDEHRLGKIQGRKKVCRWCSKIGQKTAGNRAKETTFWCIQCRVALCRGDCFLEYHYHMRGRIEGLYNPIKHDSESVPLEHLM